MKWNNKVEKWCKRWDEETTPKMLSQALTGGNGRCYVIKWELSDKCTGTFTIDGAWYDKVTRLHRQLRQNGIPVPSPMANVEGEPPKPILLLIGHHLGRPRQLIWDNDELLTANLIYWKDPANCAEDAGVGINQYI